MQAHQAAGDVVGVITATNRFIAEAVGGAFGFAPDHILATELVYDSQGRMTGDVAGIPNLRDGKVGHFTDWLQQRGWGWNDVHVTFYSDSHNDLPLMEKANTPIPTNPDSKLRAIAQERGWKVVDLFETVHA